MEIREKWKIFVNRSVPENFQWEFFLGQLPTESLRTQDSENVYDRWVQQMFDPVLVARLDVRIHLEASKIYHTYTKN